MTPTPGRLSIKYVKIKLILEIIIKEEATLGGVLYTFISSAHARLRLQ